MAPDYQVTRPPVARGLPLLGSVRGMSRDMRAFLTEQYLELGPVFRLRVLHCKFTVLAGLEANAFATTEGGKYLGADDPMKGVAKEMGSKNFMLIMDGKVHSRLREINRWAYSPAFLYERLGEAVEIARHQMSEWPPGKAISGLYALQRIATQQMGMLEMGISPRRNVEDKIEYGTTTLMVRASHLRPAGQMLLPRYRCTSRRVDEFLAQVRKVHEPEISCSTRSPDLMDDLLAAAQSNPDIVTPDDFKASLPF